MAKDKLKTSRGRSYSAKALKAMIKAGRKTPSLYVKIAESMSKASDQPYHRQEVGAWLHQDPEARIEPRLGTGLLLIKCGTQIIESQKKKDEKAKAKTRGGISSGDNDVESGMP